ncbi:MAG: TetR/AcrR family transcriptional regulator [Phycisphaerales bacterium]|nr:TetR/AcrR family transcriptional regulator [Phycisphaerales bacterium]MCB9857098.1 TetR/AcrR family transcriptional regulator [Phycisphaerales bacterium]MCB9861775.1 TetR/AcrR family transcriptional regulator [Phycisphaerales bacterium]
MSGGSTSRRMKADDRRQHLLEAAISCFSQYGYQGTTTARLARAAQVSEPVLYRHFKSKQELFASLVEEVGKEVIRAWRHAIAPLKSPMDQLRVLFRLNPAITDPRTKQLYQVIFMAQTEIGDPNVQAALREHYEQYARFLANLIKRAQRAGQVRRDVSAVGLAWQLVHAAIGFAFIKPLAIPGHATPATVEQTIGLLLEMLSGDRPGEG